MVAITTALTLGGVALAGFGANDLFDGIGNFIGDITGSNQQNETLLSRFGLSPILVIAAVLAFVYVKESAEN